MSKAFVMSEDEAVELWNSATGNYFEAQLVDYAAKAINHYKDTIPESVLSDSDARIQDYAEQHMLTLEEAVDALTPEGYLPDAILQAATRDAMGDRPLFSNRQDAARYQWLKAWNKLDGWTDEMIDRQIAIDAAIAASAPKGDGND